jgi:hypothetical protein
MPRGIKGSGKSRKPAGEPGQPRRRGRKPREPLPEAVPPAEPTSPLQSTEEPTSPLQSTEEPTSPLPASEPPTTAELQAEPPAAESPTSEPPTAEPSCVEEAPAESQTDLQAVPVQDPAMQKAERQLAAKYPLVNIRPGSLRGAGERPEHPGKRTVVILCGRCSSQRVLATSDLFHVRYCESCSKAERKAARKKGAKQ